MNRGSWLACACVAALALAGCKREAAPAPAAVMSGTTPSDIAAVVIRIGRRRTLAEAMMASRRDSPCSRRCWLANSTSRIPCLVMRPISVMRPTSV